MGGRFRCIDVHVLIKPSNKYVRLSFGIQATADALEQAWEAVRGLTIAAARKGGTAAISHRKEIAR